MEDEKTSLCDALNFREAAYANFTEQALKPIQEKLSQAAALFLKIDSPIIWSDIKALVSQPKCLMVFGYVLHPIGKILQLNEETFVEITPENVHLFKRTFRFIFDMTLLEKGTTVQILKFMIDLTAISDPATEEELDKLMTEYNYDTSPLLTSCDIYNRILERITKPTEIAGFNASLLNDDQIKMLHSLSNCVSGTIN